MSDLEARLAALERLAAATALGVGALLLGASHTRYSAEQKFCLDAHREIGDALAAVKKVRGEAPAPHGGPDAVVPPSPAPTPESVFGHPDTNHADSWREAPEL